MIGRSIGPDVLALTKADEANGCLWFTPGSQYEPVYPDCGGRAVDRHSHIGDSDHD